MAKSNAIGTMHPGGQKRPLFFFRNNFWAVGVIHMAIGLESIHMTLGLRSRRHQYL